MITAPENLFTPENLYKAYRKARRGKRRAVGTIAFETNLYGELSRLSQSLLAGTYSPSRFVCFYVQKPKLREIFAAHFRDRVVHHAIIEVLEPHYEKSFIADSFANRRGKGTHAAVARLKEFVRKGTSNGQSQLYFLQLDIKGFFMSIHKETLLLVLSRRVQPGTRLFQAIRAIIGNDAARDAIVRGKRPAPGVLPPHKTLFQPDKAVGVPIGNLTSQFFANVYLNELDQYVKRRLALRYYIRYVDDFLLLNHDPEVLLDAKQKIIAYVSEHLHLTLKDENAIPQSVYRGIDFLGYFVKPAYTLVRRRVVRNFKRALAQLLPPIGREKQGVLNLQYFNEMGAIKSAQARINSYLSHFRHASSIGLIRSLQKTLLPFRSVLSLSSRVVRVPRFHRFHSLNALIRLIGNHFPEHVFLVKAGTYLRLYGSNAALLARCAGLSLFTSKKQIFARANLRSQALSRLRVCMDYRSVSYVVLQEKTGITEKLQLRLPVRSRTYSFLAKTEPKINMLIDEIPNQ